MKNLTLDYYNEYIKNCKPLINELEKSRNIWLNTITPKIMQYSILLIILLLIDIISISILCWNGVAKIFTPGIEFIIIALTALSIVGTFYHCIFGAPKLIKNVNKTNKDFKKILKNKFLPHLIKPFENLKVSNNKILLTELHSCELFENLETYKVETDDCFEGEYQTLNFRIQECNLLGGKSTSYFRGLVIEIDSNKNVKNTTLLTSKQDIYTGINSLILNLITLIVVFLLTISYFYLQVITKNHNILSYIVAFLVVLAIIHEMTSNIKEKFEKENFEKITLEDVKTNKRFNAYSSDQIEGRYLLTPAFIERFNNLKTVFGTNKIKCSFHKNKLYIAISTKKDLFELGTIFKSVHNQNEINNFYNEIFAIYKIIEYLKLDEKTGL